MTAHDHSYEQTITYRCTFCDGPVAVPVEHRHGGPFCCPDCDDPANRPRSAYQ